jgi:alpha-tubulin suppressor-like RCC1 family protein
VARQVRGKYVLDLSCGMAHTVMVDLTGDTYAWGVNSHHQCGIPHAPLPVYLAPLLAPRTRVRDRAWQVASSQASGRRADPQSAARDSSSGVAVPTIIPALVGVSVTAVACGTGHSIAVASDGVVYSWGLGKQVGRP